MSHAKKDYTNKVGLSLLRAMHKKYIVGHNRVSFLKHGLPIYVVLSLEINKSKALANRIPSLLVSRDCRDYINYTRNSFKSQLQISMDVLFLRKVRHTYTKCICNRFKCCKIWPSESSWHRGVKCHAPP